MSKRQHNSESFRFSNLTLQQLRMEDIYPSENGIIICSGKFQDQAVYVPYFYNVWRNGFADLIEGNIAYFRIMKEDKKLFPEIEKKKKVIKLKISANNVMEI